MSRRCLEAGQWYHNGALLGLVFGEEPNVLSNLINDSEVTELDTFE